MPEIEVTIGGRSFEVACQSGEEPFLQAAAAMLNAEATALSSQIGRIPEARMLLMAGLMLADRTASLEDRLAESEARVAEMARKVAELETRPPEVVRETVELRVEVPVPVETRVEVPVERVIEVPRIPPGHLDWLEDLAQRAETLADQVEQI